LDDIETIIAQAKERRQKAQGLEAMQTLQDEGVFPNGNDSEKREISAYERAADTITGGLHKVDDAKAVLQNANIPTKVLAPVLEIIITTEAMIEEFREFSGMTKKLVKGKWNGDFKRRHESTLDMLTLEENRVLVEEAIRIMESIPIILTAKDGFRSIQAGENLKSLVTGESLMRANEAGASAYGQTKGILGTMKGWLVGKK